ncbi:MAG: ABC transporter ATP-binding protein [Ferruginibacter sp.]
MHINLTNTGKRYNRDWIFRHLDYQFFPGKKYAIIGPNGSGKSTLLQVIAGATIHSEGELSYTDDGKKIEEPYSKLSFCAPYLDLIEELTAKEFLAFHEKFKPLSENSAFILNAVGLSNAENKQIRYFSSGMKQRIKLAQAFFCKSQVLFLDEPTSNLDLSGVKLYQELLKNYIANKLVIISSNEKLEYEGCDEVIEISNYKV